MPTADGTTFLGALIPMSLWPRSRKGPASEVIADQSTILPNRDSSDPSDTYYAQPILEETEIQITPSQYASGIQKIAPPSVCGINGANLRIEMGKFESENANYRPKSDPKLRIVQNGIGAFTGLEPGSDVFLARNEAMNKAVLNAKANIIKTIHQKISAEQLIMTPVSGLSVEEKIDAQATALRGQFKTLTAEIEILGREYEELTSAVLAGTSADNLIGLTSEDRVNSFFEAAIKKLDESYDPATATEAKKKKVADLKAALTRKEG